MPPAPRTAGHGPDRGGAARSAAAVVGSVLVAVLLSACGLGSTSSPRSTTNPEAAAARADPSCRRIADPGTYRALGLRPLPSLGESGREVRGQILAILASPAARVARAEHAGLSIVSYSDGDSRGDLGERVAPKDEEDVAVVSAPGLAGDRFGNDRLLRRAAAVQRAEVRAAGRREKVELRFRSTLRDGVLRGYITLDGTSYEARTVAFGGRCGIVRLIGWPTAVRRAEPVVLRLAGR